MIYKDNKLTLYHDDLARQSRGKPLSDIKFSDFRSQLPPKESIVDLINKSHDVVVSINGKERYIKRRRPKSAKRYEIDLAILLSEHFNRKKTKLPRKLKKKLKKHEQKNNNIRQKKSQ